ncbi:radical SAM protein [bacterium]|nr:radical SAM protein [bacterium]
MPFYKVTYSQAYRRASVHNYGCNFHCPICSYLLRGSDRPGLAWPRPERFLSLDEIEQALRQLDLALVNFMGGEPTTASDLPALLRFAKEDLALPTRLGHTNGSNLPLPNLDGANVGLKAWDPAVHLEYTGMPKERIFGNFTAAHQAGLELRANTVLIPGYVDRDQVEAMAAFVARLDPAIPFHINGYFEVPGQPYRSPTRDELDRAVEACQRHVTTVTVSHLSAAQARDLTARDGRFVVERVL